MNRKIGTLILGALALAIIFGACAGARAKSYDKLIGPVMREYRNERFRPALAQANNLVKRTWKKKGQNQDKFLALLERGKVALAAGDYNTAINDLRKAEGEFINIEGRISIKEELGSLFSNELGKKYQVEPYEMISISPYLALAYLAKGDFTGAVVERNRTINKINKYLSRTRKSHLENPFARFLAALIYEMEGKIDDVRIEYRKMSKYFAHLKHLEKEYQRIKAISRKEKKPTDLVVLIDVGVAPQKKEVKYGPKFVRIGDMEATIKFAYAKLKPAYSIVEDCRVSVNGKEKDARLLYNLEETVIKQYGRTAKKRKSSILKRVLIKVTASLGVQAVGKKVKGAAGAIIGLLGKGLGRGMAFMEKADLRNWATLPKEILYSRIRNLKPGNNTVKIFYAGFTKNISVNLKKGQVNLIYAAVPR